jgi:hypothetical protein
MSCSSINAALKYLMGRWELPKRSLISSNILICGIRIAASEDSEEKAQVLL